MHFLTLALYAATGALAASLLACIPALHIYNVAGLLLIAWPGLREVVPDAGMAMLFLGLIVGYAIANTIPSIFFAAPDDSTLFVVLPGQKYLLQGRGYEAAILTGIGSLGGLLVLVAVSPLAPIILPIMRSVVAPHLHWILAAVIAYMLMSEFPRSTDRALTPLRRWLEAWKGPGAGLLTFLLSGLLGFILLYRSPISVDFAFQNLLPAFMGLFAIPWVLMNLISRVELPAQFISTSVDVRGTMVARGVFAGTLGGMLAAFFPVITGGIGGLIAGQIIAQRDDRLFMISQGASKIVYYVGAYLLFFVPGLHLTRGGMAWMLSTFFSPATPEDYFLAVAAMAAAGTVAFFMLLLMSRAVIGLVRRVDYRRISAATLALLVGMVAVLTGPAGLLVAAVATGIGLIPALTGARRLNCMGILLLPITLNMGGVGTVVAHWMGLL